MNLCSIIKDCQVICIQPPSELSWMAFKTWGNMGSYIYIVFLISSQKKKVICIVARFYFFIFGFGYVSKIMYMYIYTHTQESILESKTM